MALLTYLISKGIIRSLFKNSDIVIIELFKRKVIFDQSFFKNK